MGFTGDLESFSLADLFQNLAMNQQTGTLRVFTKTGEEKNIFFEKGQVRRLSKGAKDSIISAEVFLARGLTNRQGLELASDRQKQTGQSIGLCLLELGQINQEQLDDITRHQVEEEIYDLFSWERANFEFIDGSPASVSTTGQLPTTGQNLAISQLIMEAARRVDEWERLRKLVPQYKEIYAMDVAVRRSIEAGEMEMDPIEKRVAGQIDGARDVDDLIEDSALFKFEVVNALAAFLQSSLIRPASAAELKLAEEDCARSNLTRRRIKVLERMLALGGENPKVRRDLADLLAKSNEVERACIHFSVLADAEARAGKEDVAQEYYAKILAISPRHVKSHEQLAAMYAKRGKKREAFTHYQELFETFREQNHMREARVAAACALECDPAHTDLRTSLIDLLLADKQTDAAAQQLELMGDQYARQNNVKMSSDAYRRALQHRPGNKHLKKKLADAMLTKEDRRARKTKFYTAVVVLLVIGIIGGSLTFIEGRNAARLGQADAEAGKIADGARAKEQSSAFKDAETQFNSAAEVYAPLYGMFSPLMHYNEDARRRSAPFAESARLANEKARELNEREMRRAKADLEEADAALRAGSIYEAKEKYGRVSQNPSKDEDTARAAVAGMSQANARIADFEDGKSKIKRPPLTEFQTLDQESSYKRKFWWDYKRYLSPDEVKIPLLIKPNTEEVNVTVDGTPLGVVSQTAADKENTFRLSFGSHKLEFHKTGYKTLALNTSELQTAVYELNLERQPALRFDLQRDDPAISLSGSVLYFKNQMFVGTENGSLIQLGEPDTQIVRRYDLPNGTAALTKDVIGQIYGFTRPGKPDMLVYATRAGDCIGLEAAPGEAKFTEKFKLQVKNSKNQPVQLSPQAPPSVMRLKIYGDKPVMVVPVEQKLYLVDCDAGTQVPTPLELRAAATTAAVGIEQNSLIVVGCADGNLYGLEMGKEASREWSTGSRNAMIRGLPTFADEKLVAGTSDGKIYFFDPTKQVDRRPDSVTLGEGSIDAEPLIYNRRLYVGATLKEGFYCVDLAGRKVLWDFSRVVPDMGGVQFGAAGSGNCVYLCTDAGRLYCLDAERGRQRWVYQFPSGVKFSAPPLVVENRVYCFTKSGLILAFDESPSKN